MRTYLTRLREARESQAEEGFTLIELLVVLLILGILLAIAIPTFLTVTKSATNTAASSNLQTALTGAETYYTTNNGSYSGIYAGTTVSNITQEGTGLVYTTGGTASTKSGIISLDYVNASNIVLAAWNGSDRCYAIAAEKTTGGIAGTPSKVGTYYGYFKPSTSGGCTASAAEASGGITNWQDTGGFPA